MEQLKHSDKELREAVVAIFMKMIEDTGDDVLIGHSKRVAEYTKMFFRLLEKRGRYLSLGLDSELIENVVAAATLHDLGKLTISRELLDNEDPFTDDEYTIMKLHTKAGYDIIQRVFGDCDSQFISVLKELTRHHHERYDGNGYPDGIGGRQLPVYVQIVSIADVYDAITSERTYEGALPHAVAIDILTECAENGEYDSRLMEVLDVFVEHPGMQA